MLFGSKGGLIMSKAESAVLVWLCLAQAVAVYHAAGFVLGLILRERADPYEARHRADRGGVSTWQSHGRAWTARVAVPDPDDLQDRRAAVEAAAVAILERAEVWNRELLAGPLFDPALERYEGSAGDLAYLQLTDGSLDRTALIPARPHPARIDTSELTIIDLDEDVSDYVIRDDALASVP